VTIGERIQMLRKNNGLSQEDLAKKLLVSRQTVSQWETDQTIPSVDNIYRLKEILNVSFDELMSDEKAEKVETEEKTEEEKPLEEYESVVSREETEFAMGVSTSGLSGRKMIFLGALLFAYTVYCICVDSAGFFLGFLIGVFVLALAVYLSFAQNRKRELQKYDNMKNVMTLKYKVFPDRLESAVLKNDEVIRTDVIRKDEIDSFVEKGDFCAFIHGNHVFSVNKKIAGKDSYLYSFIYKDPTLKVVRKTKKTFLSVLTIILSIASVFAVMIIDAMRSDYFDQLTLENLWISFLFLPIPVFSILYGIYQQKKGYRNIRNIVVGVCIFLILSAMGASSFLSSSEYYSDFSLLLNWEERLDIDFPDRGEILTAYPDHLLDSGIEGYNEKTTVRLEKKDRVEFSDKVAGDERWITEYHENLLPCFLNGDYDYNFDYHMLVNLTTKEINKLPEKSGMYRFAYVKYMDADGILEIEDYYIDIYIG